MRPEHRGKTPGTLGSDGVWSGLGGKWSDELQATITDLKHWQRWGASIGLQSRKFPGLDIDVEDAAIVAGIIELAQAYLGFAPERFRDGSPRRLFMYRNNGEPIRKTRLAWIDGAGGKHAVELLGHGQQYVVEGPHPKGGDYQWNEQPSPTDLTPIEAAHVEQFFTALREWVERQGYTLHAGTVAAANSSAGTRHGLDAVELHAPTPAVVLAALEAWQNTDDNVPTHDDFVAALAAIKAALGPKRENHYSDVEEWALAYDGNDADYVRKTWDSINDAAIGWEWLAGQARATGNFSADAQSDFEEEASPIAATPFDRMVGRYVWVGDLGRYNDTQGGSFLGSREFNAANVDVMPFGASGRQTAEATFQNAPNARKVATATSRPGAPVITQDENERGVPVPAVNLWRASAVKPNLSATAADVAPWLDLIEKLFGTEGTPEREHFLNWWAFVLQQAGRKIGHALVLIGGQGIGKDALRGNAECPS